MAKEVKDTKHVGEIALTELVRKIKGYVNKEIAIRHPQYGFYIYTTDRKFYTKDQWDSADNDKVVGIAVIKPQCKFILDLHYTTIRGPLCPTEKSDTITGMPAVSAAEAQIDYNGQSYSKAWLEYFSTWTNSEGNTIDVTQYGIGYANSQTNKLGDSGYIGSYGEYFALGQTNNSELAELMLACGGEPLYATMTDNIVYMFTSSILNYEHVEGTTSYIFGHLAGITYNGSIYHRNRPVNDDTLRQVRVLYPLNDLYIK